MPLSAGIMKKTGTERLVDYLYDRKEQFLTDSALEKARWCMLDELGCNIYGSTMPEAEKILDAVSSLQTEGRANVWGTQKKFSPDTAAFINGSFCHLRELDDVHYAILHTGAVCVPAALAAAQVCCSAIQQILEAVVIGTEVMVRISKGMDFLNHRERGWHGTSTCGAFGAAAAAGYLLGLTREEMVNAMGIAGSRTGGTWAFAADGAMTKRLHPGLAARDGILSAFLAKQGIQGPHYILEAQDGGFYRVMSSSWDMDKLDEAQSSAMEDIEFKWFASCKSVHSPITAAREIFQRNPLRNPENVKSIKVYVNRSAIEMAGGQYRSESVTSAQISIPYGVALGLYGYQGTAADYSPERLRDERIKRTASLVEILESEEMNRLRREEKRSAAIVEVCWENGESEKAFVKAPKGSMFAPLTKQDIRDKFYSLTEEKLGKEKAAKIEQFLMHGKIDVQVTELEKMI